MALYKKYIILHNGHDALIETEENKIIISIKSQWIWYLNLNKKRREIEKRNCEVQCPHFWQIFGFFKPFGFYALDKVIMKNVTRNCDRKKIENSQSRRKEQTAGFALFINYKAAIKFDCYIITVSVKMCMCAIGSFVARALPPL